MREKKRGKKGGMFAYLAFGGWMPVHRMTVTNILTKYHVNRLFQLLLPL